MKLAELLHGFDCHVVGAERGVTIRDIQIDSREVVDGTLFVARVGWYDDGHTYIDAAIAAGAAAIAVSRADTVPAEPKVPFVIVENEDTFLADVAVRFFRDPTASLNVIGVTGTNGKTTVAFLVSQLLDLIGAQHALISTVHYRVGDEVFPAPNTTPDSLVIQRLARRALDAGARFLVMEVSSHGIAHERIRGVSFDCVGFTNLTREHLDFHGTFEAYRETKRRLFTDVLTRHDKETTAVVCIDSDEGRAVYGLSDADRTLSVSAMCGTSCDLGVLESDTPGSWFLKTDAASFIGATALVGGFNRANLGVALGLVSAATRQDWHDLFRLTPELQSAPGRLQRAFAPQKSEPDVFVDYAHTPDAVRAVIAAVCESATGRRVVAVVGCGGDRDRGKRPEMAQAAVERSSFTIFTSDNPRSESAADILREMTDGLADDGQWIVVEGRSEAIHRAIREAGDGVVLLLGKGHESYQEIAGARYSLNDGEEARRAIASLRAGCSMSETPLLCGWSAARVADAVGGTLCHDTGVAGWRSLTTDSRHVGTNDIFVALRGDRFDGHEYAEAAIHDGARLLLIEDAEVVASSLASVITVDDTNLALLRLSRALLDERRSRVGRFGVVGITGSNGKTTVKEMTALLVSSISGAPALKTLGNFNNRIGMPLSAVRVADGHEAAILELGANHSGEIAELVEYAKPEVAVLTSIGEAHTAGFGSIEGVRKAKREIFAGPGLKTAIVPHDEIADGESRHRDVTSSDVANAEREQAETKSRRDFWIPARVKHVIDFGTKAGSVRASRRDVKAPVELEVIDEHGETTWSANVALALPGHHQGTNLAAALAAAVTLCGVAWPDEASLNQWVSNLVVPGGRWAEHRVGSRLLIDDAYNANPTSMKASIDTISEHAGVVWVVLGTMHELSDDAAAVHAAHQALGAHAANKVDVVIAVGEFADAISEGAGDRGVACTNGVAAINYIQEHAPEDAVLLFKGSRAARLEDVIGALLDVWEVA